MKNISALFFFLIAALPLAHSQAKPDPYPTIQEPHKSMLIAIDRIARGVSDVRAGGIGLKFPYGSMAADLHDAAGAFFLTLSC